MELSVPFTCQVEAPGLTSQGTILADPRLRWAEARVLNPRKILLRVDLAVEIRPASCERTICQGVEAAEEHGIRQLQEEQTTDQIVAVQEKPFTFTDGVDLGLSEGGELLSLRGEPSCEESRLIGSKLIFKGSVELHALLRDADGTLRTARESMPFSQIIEVPGAGEDAECEVRVVLTDLNAPAIGTTVLRRGDAGAPGPGGGEEPAAGHHAPGYLQHRMDAGGPDRGTHHAPGGGSVHSAPERP